MDEQAFTEYHEMLEEVVVNKADAIRLIEEMAPEDFAEFWEKREDEMNEYATKSIGIPF